MELHVYNAAENLTAIEETQVEFREQLREAFARGSLDFDTWTSLISEIEKTYPDDIETICLAYDSFLSKFPLCYGYWRKYADHHARLCTVEKVVETFERAVQSATYSVSLWVEYCSFSVSVFEDPCDVRRIFKRGMSFVGKDYLCHALWDKYIEFELTKQRWSFVAHIYIQTLRFPTKKLHRYYDNFKKFTAILKGEVEYQNDYNNDSDSEGFTHKAATTSKDETSLVIQDLLGPSAGSLRSKALHKYVSIGEQFYQEACQLEEKICCFETKIRRPYFHVKPLDDTQLENWHHYLDFVETQQDFDWVVKLYERCLIACANYPEFWMRYVEYMEAKGGREIANFALDRASQIFLKNVPEIHLFSARFKEHIGDVIGARAAFPLCDTGFNCYFVENVVKEANMEKRLGNFAAAYRVYEKAFELAAERQKLHTVSSLYIHFSRLKYLITESADAAIDVIVNGIQNVPNCKLLLEGLINFAMMHGVPRQVKMVDSIIANAISPRPDLSQGLSTKDREAISLLYLEFVDYCGTTHDVSKGWNRHIKLFPHSVRPNSFNSPTSDNRLLSMIIEKKQSNLSSMPDQPEDSGRLQQLSSNVPKHSEEGALEANNLNHGLVPHQSGEDANEPMESTHDLIRLSREEDESGTFHSPYDLQHQEVNDIVSLEAAQEHTDSVDVRQETEFEQHLKLPSVENLSLNPQENESRDLVHMDGHQATSTSDEVQESYRNKNENPSLANPKRSLVTDSSQIQNPKNNTVGGSEDASSGLCTHLQDQESGSPAETDSQKLTSQGYPHHSSNWPNQQVEKGGSHQAQNPYWVGAAEGNSTATGAWPLQNMQQQSAASISLLQQTPQQISQPQAQISPHPVKSSEQIEHLQSGQAFDQTWEYYYYQQQQQFQQHYLQQQQQPYQHLQPQQQQHDADPQQLMLFQQQQYLQQQQQYYQQLQQQGQQQMWQHQYYQQLQQWQQYQQQQQEYQKQLQLAQVGPEEEYQKLQQLAEQQQQGYQQLLQQQQEYYQQMSQPQHQQVYHHPQQITSTHGQTWNGNYYQQGEVVVLPQGTGASAPAESPHPQQQSPQALTPAHTAGMPHSAEEQQSPQTQ